MTKLSARFQLPISIDLRSLLLLAAGLFLAATSFAQDSVGTFTFSRAPITGPPPVTMNYILTPAPGVATAVVILLPGGDGNIHLTPTVPPDGTLSVNSNNFLVRSRWLFASEGYNVFTLDSESDFQLLLMGLEDQQGNPAHVMDLVNVILTARTTYPTLPVWLVGTSRSTAGAWVAGQFSNANGGPDGVVFTSPINVLSDPDSLLSAPLSTIVVPTLLFGNKMDTCPVTLTSGNPAVLKLLTGTKTKANENVNGGFTPLTTSCDALSPHGFFGIEPAAVTKISTWINAH